MRRCIYISAGAVLVMAGRETRLTILRSAHNAASHEVWYHIQKECGLGMRQSRCGEHVARLTSSADCGSSNRIAVYMCVSYITLHLTRRYKSPRARSGV